MNLTADRGTAGGYTKLATVIISTDVSRLVQAVPGDLVRFDSVSVEEAVAARREAERRLDNIFSGRPGGSDPCRLAIVAAVVARMLDEES